MYLMSLSILTPLKWLAWAFADWTYLLAVVNFVIRVCTFFYGTPGWANYLFPHIIILWATILFWDSVGYAGVASFLRAVERYLVSMSLLFNMGVSFLIIAYLSWTTWRVRYHNVRLYSKDALPPWWFQYIIYSIECQG